MRLRLVRNNFLVVSAMVWMMLLAFLTFFLISGPTVSNNDQAYYDGFGVKPAFSSKSIQRLLQFFSRLELIKFQLGELNKLVWEMGRKNPALLTRMQDKAKKKQTFVEWQGLNETSIFRTVEGPTTEYQLMRRRVTNELHEFWNFISSRLREVEKNEALPFAFKSRINMVLEYGLEHKRAVLSDLQSLPLVDDYDNWRIKEGTELGSLVQRRLHHLQNPPDCKHIPKLVCEPTNGYGFGFYFHYVVHCLIQAYKRNRFMVLRSSGWNYNSKGVEEIFYPLSNTCDHLSVKMNTESQPFIPLNVTYAPIPNSLPSDLSQRLIRLHGNPYAWWVGQFLKYTLRPRPSISALLEKTYHKIGFEKPIVGVHIRRTDKVGTEAKFYPVEKYMSVVDEYYNMLEMKHNIPQRSIYVAADDSEVIKEIKHKYSHYKIFFHPEASILAEKERYSKDSLVALIADIYFLSKCNYVVCTFSSRICRMAYEIMQTLYPDATDRFHSIDIPYYFSYQPKQKKVVIYPHKSRNHMHIELEKGDILYFEANYQDGYSKGKNLRTNKTGLYPSFKVENYYESEPYHTYPDVPLRLRKSKF